MRRWFQPLRGATSRLERAVPLPILEYAVARLVGAEVLRLENHRALFALLHVEQLLRLLRRHLHHARVVLLLAVLVRLLSALVLRPLLVLLFLLLVLLLLLFVLLL